MDHQDGHGASVDEPAPLDQQTRPRNSQGSVAGQNDSTQKQHGSSTLQDAAASANQFTRTSQPNFHAQTQVTQSAYASQPLDSRFDTAAGTQRFPQALHHVGGRAHSATQNQYSSALPQDVSEQQILSSQGYIYQPTDTFSDIRANFLSQIQGIQPNTQSPNTRQPLLLHRSRPTRPQPTSTGHSLYQQLQSAADYPPILPSLSQYLQLAASPPPRLPSFEQQFPVCTNPARTPTSPSILNPHESPRTHNSLAVFTGLTSAQTRNNYTRETNFVLPREDGTAHAILMTDALVANDFVRPHRGVPCSQPLLPGMHSHWGETRPCEAHALSHDGVRDFVVCKGCIVAHFGQENEGFERGIVMARGARVDVCRECAERAARRFGAGYRGCVCGTRWLCFRCREEECRVLARKRAKVRTGLCGKCLRKGEFVEWAEYCVGCWAWRIYRDGRGV